jgi:hypothetical protein
MTLDIRSALVCDFVRTEDNGKSIIIGAYTGDIVVTEAPTKFSLTFWVEFLPPKTNGEIEIDLKLETPGAKKPKTLAGTINIGPQDESTILAPVFDVDIIEPGDMVFSIRPKGGRWTQVLSKKIIIAPSEN